MLLGNAKYFTFFFFPFVENMRVYDKIRGIIKCLRLIQCYNDILVIDTWSCVISG